MIQGKVWGTTRPIETNNFFEAHRLEIKKNYRCSKHVHKYKWNGFYVEKGVLDIHIWKNDYSLVDITTLRAGDYTVVPPNEYHMFVCKKDCICFELYWPHFCANDIDRKSVGKKTK